VRLHRGRGDTRQRGRHGGCCDYELIVRSIAEPGDSWRGERANGKEADLRSDGTSLLMQA
jgi:hypothetical protein